MRRDEMPETSMFDTEIHHLSLSNNHHSSQRQILERRSNGGRGASTSSSSSSSSLSTRGDSRRIQRSGTTNFTQSHYQQQQHDHMNIEEHRVGSQSSSGGSQTHSQSSRRRSSSSQQRVNRAGGEYQEHVMRDGDSSDHQNYENLLTSQQSSIPVEITKEDHIISRTKQLTVYHSPVEVVETIKNYISQRNPGNALSDPPFTVEFPTSLSRYQASEQFNQNHPLTLMDLYYTIRYYHRLWCHDIIGPMERIARNLSLFDSEIFEQIPYDLKSKAQTYVNVRLFANNGQGIDEINNPAFQDFARIYGWWNKIRYLFIRRHLKKTMMFKDEPEELVNRLCTEERTFNLQETYEDVFTNVILCHLEDRDYPASQATEDLKHNVITRLILTHQNIISIIGLAIGGEYSHAFSMYLNLAQQSNFNTWLDQINHRLLSVVSLISENSLCFRQTTSGIEIYNNLNARDVRSGDTTLNRSVALGIQNKFFVDATKPSIRGMRYSYLMNPLTMCTSTEQQVKLIEILTGYTNAEYNNDQDESAADEQTNLAELEDMTLQSQTSDMADGNRRGRGSGKRRKASGRGRRSSSSAYAKSLLTAANKQHALIHYFLVLMFKHGYRKHITVVGGSALNASHDQIIENTYIMAPERSSIPEFRHLYTGAFKLSCRLVEFIQSHWTSDVLIAHQTFFPINDVLNQYKQITQNIASLKSEERFPTFKPNRRLISFASGRAGVVVKYDPNFKNVVYARYVYMSHADIQQKSISLGSVMSAQTSVSMMNQMRQRFIQDLNSSDYPMMTIVNENNYFWFNEAEELFLELTQSYASHVFIDGDATDAYKGVCEYVIEPMEEIVSKCHRICALVDRSIYKESDARKEIWNRLITNIGICMENLILNDGCTLFEEFFLLHMGMNVTGASKYQSMMTSSTTKPHKYESYNMTTTDCFQALACLLCLFGTYLLDRRDKDLNIDVFVLLIGASNIGKSKILEMFQLIYGQKVANMNISSESTFQLFPVLEKEPQIVICHEFTDKASLSKAELLSWATDESVRLAIKSKSSLTCFPVAKLLAAGNVSPAKAWSEQGSSRDNSGNSQGGAMSRRLIVLTLHFVPEFEKKDKNIVQETQKKELPKVICRMMSLLCIMRPFLPEMQDYINQVKYLAIMHREFIRSMDIIKPFFQDQSFFMKGDGFILTLSDIRLLIRKYFETNQSAATIDAYFQEAVQYLSVEHELVRISSQRYVPIMSDEYIVLEHVELFKGIRYTSAARVFMNSKPIGKEAETQYNMISTN